MYCSYLLRRLSILALLAGLAACGGDTTSGPPRITITTPTSAASYATTSTSVRLGGSIAGAGFVRVHNSTTGSTTNGFVNYVGGVGSWFVDVPGLVPGGNVLVATADADGTGARTASATLTVNRPTQPASQVLNAANAAAAVNHWVDTHSFGGGHVLALYADGSGRASTGSALTQPAGAVAGFSWAYDGAEAIRISGCASCAYQRISRISGSTAEGGFYGQVETVGGATETALHFFQLTPGIL